MLAWLLARARLQAMAADAWAWWIVVEWWLLEAWGSVEYPREPPPKRGAHEQ